MSDASAPHAWCEATPALGEPMLALVRRLFPICRSITGNGVRETLRIVGEVVPLTMHEVASGTRVLDWTIPKEWNIRDGYIADARGNRVVDFRANNLHVVGYSTPVRARMPLDQLQSHLYSLPEQPDLIPYRTSYYEQRWGFCLSHRQRLALAPGDYDVVIDSTLTDGGLSYGECVLRGTSDEEVLFYTHTCHPSLANDNLSGIVVCAYLARLLGSVEHRYTYRFVFGPGTIGSLAWLSRHQEHLPKIRHGLVAVLLGDRAGLRYKQSRQGDHVIDRVVARVLRQTGRPHTIEPFSPYGYDERQFGSPGFNLPVGRLSRSAEEGYPEYHTSADTPVMIAAEALSESLRACVEVCATLESDACYVNTRPFGEPQLGRYGLYRKAGGDALPDRERALLWVLNYSDGDHSLIDIAERSGLTMRAVCGAADDLVAAGLLVPRS